MSFKTLYFNLVLILNILPFLTIGQNQKLADSLVVLYNSGSYEDKEIELIKEIARYETNPDVKLGYVNLIIEKGTKASSIENLQIGYGHKGDALKMKGNYAEALEAYFKSLEFAKEIKDQLIIARTTISVADTYSALGNSKNAETYYDEGISLLRKTSDSLGLASGLLNAGDEYFNSKNYNKAIKYFEESGKIFERFNYPIGSAYNLGNIGMVYAELGQNDLAEKNINQAIIILEELEDYYPISVYLTYMADIYAQKGDMQTALNYSQRSLDLATQYGLKDQVSEANLKLSELYEQSGNKDASLSHYKDHIVYRDSVRNIEAVQQMADLRTDYEVSQKQVEVDLLNQKQKTQKIIVIATLVALALIGFLAFGLFKRNKFIKKTNKIIEAEKNKSDKLLLNILPEETAEELKEKGRVAAKKFESVTVLFSDFRNFTLHAEHLSPEDLVKSVDYYFSKFDDIIDKHQLEKIKTVGDAYMCAGGLPDMTTDHAERMVLAALDMLEFVEFAKQHNPDNQTRYDIRIGISTGPVVAGVVGKKKFVYDIWGNTVNVASRMESYSEPGKINISEDTYLLIKNKFQCTERGEIEVKNKGLMKMYFIGSSPKVDTVIIDNVEANTELVEIGKNKDKKT